jgi:prepilin-type N-terminal cleavage/methylation domain-containing protein
MKRKIQRFTLVEMLTVIAIIGILAAIVTPIVVISRQRGMATQAQSDITSIMAAMKAMDADYGRVLRKDSTNYKIGGQTASVTSDIATLTGDAYNAMIAELSVPKADGLSVSVNKRKKVYLEPRKDYVPGTAYTSQTSALYRDPWGNPYVIYVKVTKDDELEVPGTTKKIIGNFAVYSFGVDGDDDKGCNADLENCINSSDSGNHKQHDDIASWQM